MSWRVEATEIPSTVVRVVNDEGLCAATIECADVPRHHFRTAVIVHHPYNGTILATVRVKKGNPVTNSDIENRADGN